VDGAEGGNYRAFKEGNAIVHLLDLKGGALQGEVRGWANRRPLEKKAGLRGKKIRYRRVEGIRCDIPGWEKGGKR